MRSLQERVAALRPSLPVAVGQSALPFLVAIALAYLINAVLGPAVGATWTKILLDIGIAILLAGSLNIVNGYAGQFSLGHAGFMLAGGYTAAWLTFYGAHPLVLAPATADGGFLGAGQLLFLGGCLLGGRHRGGAGRDRRACRRCGCAATTSPSSRSGSARS